MQERCKEVAGIYAKSSKDLGKKERKKSNKELEKKIWKKIARNKARKYATIVARN